MGHILGLFSVTSAPPPPPAPAGHPVLLLEHKADHIPSTTCLRKLPSDLRATSPILSLDHEAWTVRCLPSTLSPGPSALWTLSFPSSGLLYKQFCHWTWGLPSGLLRRPRAWKPLLAGRPELGLFPLAHTDGSRPRSAPIPPLVRRQLPRGQHPSVSGRACTQWGRGHACQWEHDM